MYSKYDNHQKVLLFLKEKRNEYLKRKEKLKKEIESIQKLLEKKWLLEQLN